MREAPNTGARTLPVGLPVALSLRCTFHAIPFGVLSTFYAISFVVPFTYPLAYFFRYPLVYLFRYPFACTF